MADGELRRNPAPRAPRKERDAEGAAATSTAGVPDAARGDEDAQESDAARRRRRAQFLRELHEAKQLRDRVQPRRARAARMRQQMRMRTFRW
ncbi:MULTISPECIES: hypothetical protein [Streptomyces]|uniref:hypothetical protein n=1 Tax=Streptomyces TaxID=1883 RepID=UPI0004C15D15|nr:MULTISPECIES: hypothetical protein [Streptomyces]MYW80983.1 hypothetical protein [Streptomyces sp. SID8369]QRV55686.1 hypothetical protein I6J40_16885 [Streptomyces californicus]SDD03582.1 hypothetical protein F610DRAFT_03443 [Streptomyces sp. LaPpAH-199]